jgi:hypothetical protein
MKSPRLLGTRASAARACGPSWLLLRQRARTRGGADRRIAFDGDQAFPWGWAYQQGEPRSIRVDIYVDRSASDTPRGTGVVTGIAHLDSEPAANGPCRDESVNSHRFFIALPSDAARKGVAGLYAHGIRLSDAFPNLRSEGRARRVSRSEAKSSIAFSG